MTAQAGFDARGAGEGRGDMLDLSALWAAIKRRKFWIVVPTLIALGLSFAAVNVVTPRYTGEARLLLENRGGFYALPGQSLPDSAGQFDSEAVQSQVQVIMSRDLAREAIKRIGLVGNAEFDSGVGALGALRKLAVMVGLGAHPADRSPEERVLEKYFDRLLVYPVARSRIVSIEFTSQDPALAAKGANIIAETYLEFQEAAKQENARSASNWLSTTIEPLRKRVADAEAKVEDFRSQNGLFSGPNNTTITSQQLTDLSTQLSNARSQQAEAQAKAGLIRDAIKQGRTFEIPDVANNDLIRRLIEQRVNLRAQIAAESRSLLPEHPRIKELNAQLGDLEGQLRAAAERAVRTLENEAKIAGQRVESFQAALDGQKKNVSSANDSEVQLRALEREARALRDQLEQYMQRYREAVARDTMNATPADARIISRAIEPTEPSFPKKVPVVLVSTLATFLIALATIVTRELLDGQGRQQGARGGPRWVSAGASEDEAGPGGPVPGTPRHERVAGLLTHAGRLGQSRLDLDRPELTLAEIAERTREPARGMAPLALVLDGAGEGAARPRDLAELLAQRCRCVLVDLSRDHETGEAGFSELLAGEALFSDIIMREPGSRLHRIGAGRAGRAAVLAASDLVDVALDALCETYDWVLVAAASSDEAAVLAPLARRAQAGLVMSGQVGNGHALETAYRLSELTEAPVTLVLDPEEGVPMAPIQHPEMPAGV
ncbi:exopolysaccharide transport family protein [Bosea sp. (in: a-proteobacteria)]|uniref:GumC family protein n=1 Tax=Bosea sp. (in: a-proteobacteria) TaxID=1871050 RepID=UPI002624227D|nr:exopolysaccharide transport family protein [Bosea sp. (in: a-proteobacteria)]MCO5092867.1 exopolysaccharide transport family protein [Bosea sp. (in: a-proteobacteria)]